MSRSKLQSKLMRKRYANVEGNTNEVCRNPHRLDEVPKNRPSKYITKHCDWGLVSWLQESTSYGGHSIPKGGHRRVCGIVRARVKEDVGDRENCSYSLNHCPDL